MTCTELVGTGVDGLEGIDAAAPMTAINPLGNRVTAGSHLCVSPIPDKSIVVTTPVVNEMLSIDVRHVAIEDPKTTVLYLPPIT
jgi:hypothetical protein